jgi:hypothetical protein
MTTLTVKVADLESFVIFMEKLTNEIRQTRDPVTRRVVNDAIKEFFNGSPDK